MIPGALRKLLTTNWHFVGVVLYFILHGYMEHAGVVSFGNLCLLLLALLAAGTLIFALCTKLFRSQRKAGLLTSAVMTAVLFFGVFQDIVAGFRLLSFAGRLVIFLPLIWIALLVLFLLLKRSTRALSKPLLFVNVLLLIYIVVDLGKLAMTAIAPGKKENRIGDYVWKPCDTCSKPPVYLVLMDSYMGSAGLKEFFQYDNSYFEDSLQRRGFRVLNNTHSNYIYTVYSMCSMLNMAYMDIPRAPEIADFYAYHKGVNGILNNETVKAFRSQGYEVKNCSIFDQADMPAGYKSGQLLDNIRLLNRQTMYYRVWKYLPVFLSRFKWFPKFTSDDEYGAGVNNEAMMQVVLTDAQGTDDRPSFTYLHLMLPHVPLLYDSLGNRLPIPPAGTVVPASVSAARFLQYQVYANRRILPFIDQLKQSTRGKAVILLMSDHGYARAHKKEVSLGYQNLNAVYLPGQNTAGWYDGMTNVNQFRVLLNTLFHQQLPMLRDSIVH